MVRTTALASRQVPFEKHQMALNLWDVSIHIVLWNGAFYQVMKRQFMDLMVH